LGRRHDQRLVSGRPRHAILGGHVRDRPVAAGERRSELVAEPLGDPSRGLTASQVWVNDRRGHSDSRHHSRRFRHHSSICWPHAGRSLTRTSGRSFTATDSTPQLGHGPSRAACSMINFTAARPVRATLTMANSASRPNNTAAGSDNTWDNSSIASVMLVASLLVAL
jgi:hypothetical protein